MQGPAQASSVRGGEGAPVITNMLLRKGASRPFPPGGVSEVSDVPMGRQTIEGGGHWLACCRLSLPSGLPSAHSLVPSVVGWGGEAASVGTSGRPSLQEQRGRLQEGPGLGGPPAPSAPGDRAAFGV